MKTWTLDVKEAEDGELFLELPEEALKLAEFSIGDTLVWSVQEDGSITLSKKTE
jgi:hypothetical protein